MPARPPWLVGPMVHAEMGREDWRWFLRCPACDAMLEIDREQYLGRRLIACPVGDCTYEATHDMSDYEQRCANVYGPPLESGKRGRRR